MNERAKQIRDDILIALDIELCELNHREQEALDAALVSGFAASQERTGMLERQYAELLADYAPASELARVRADNETLKDALTVYTRSDRPALARHTLAALSSVSVDATNKEGSQ